MQAHSSFGLSEQGISTSADIQWNLPTPLLVEAAVRNGEGLLAKDGPLVVATGKHTGRSAKASSSFATPGPRTRSAGATSTFR